MGISLPYKVFKNDGPYSTKVSGFEYIHLIEILHYVLIFICYSMCVVAEI